MDSLGSQLVNAFGTKDPYAILGLERTATDEDVKKAYRKAALRHHPDKGGDAEKFKACCVAHSILSSVSILKIAKRQREIIIPPLSLLIDIHSMHH
eukprot:GSChrysophyteH1.ASY1.ANO1.1447.1 assembled CDS